MKFSVQLTALAAVLAAALLTGCPNPNAIGVQTTGSLTVTCVQASNGQPVSGALVSIGSTLVETTNGNGVATFNAVPTGTQNVVANAPGLTGSTTVTIVENQSKSATISMTPS